MQIDLNGKTILLGVTGSISAYKACDIARLFVKAGADVHIIMTSSAERFVSALTFEALTRNKVLTDSTESWSSELNHIDIGKKCDIFVIAPATANTINKLKCGIADNILTQTALAYTREIIIAPAANTNMLLNHATHDSMDHLRSKGYTFVEPQEKLLACGDTGSGALAEPVEVFYAAAKALLKEVFWEGREVLVTGGGSREKIDEVRYISNFSSGKMASALSLALYLKGANVTYISTMGFNDLPMQIKRVNANCAEDILKATQESIATVTAQTTEPVPYLFMVAAVADFKPANTKEGKVKKSSVGTHWNIELEQTTDILSTIDKSKIKAVGFKAEMDSQEGLNNAIALLENKGVDAVCYNLLDDAKSFGGSDNEITFITKDTQVALGRTDKLTLAKKIIDLSKGLIDG
ncbi:MAG TPA: bifunctional phosphopantothenoylcysteine decarboxylase/phosphopantothenate--cysteine ligase CoaBC [Sulfurovum sp.]